jgi:hypothetical protein
VRFRFVVRLPAASVDADTLAGLIAPFFSSHPIGFLRDAFKSNFALAPAAVEVEVDGAEARPRELSELEGRVAARLARGGEERGLREEEEAAAAAPGCTLEEDAVAGMVRPIRALLEKSVFAPPAAVAAVDAPAFEAAAIG